MAERLKRDVLGPKENQSPVWKHRPSNGANLEPDPDYVTDSLIGGPKHTSTGGSESEYHDSPGAVEREARDNYGIETPEGPYFEEFSEGGEPPEEKSQGATLTRGSVD